MSLERTMGGYWKGKIECAIMIQAHQRRIEP